MNIYRGINCDMYSNSSRTKYIHPKAHVFEIIFKHDGLIWHDGSATYGKSARNAVIGHQIDSSVFKTSGISTTPHIDRAKFYALNGKKHGKGYIIEFDTEKLDKYEYQLIIVSDIVKSPHCPDDSEIILRRFDNNSIPFASISRVLKIDVELIAAIKCQIKKLPVMNIEELKDNLRHIISLRDEIISLKKNTRLGYSLHEYIEQLHERLICVDHGERDCFFGPKYIATTKLADLLALDKTKFSTAFSTNKTKLLSIVNRYIKDLQRGFVEHDLEFNSIH